MDRLINENAVLSAIGEWIAHNEHTYTNATEYLRNRVKAIKTAEQEPTTKEKLVVEDCISRQATVERLCKVAEFMNEKRNGLGSPYVMAALFIQDNKDEFPPVTPKPKTDVLDKIRAEIHATAEMHEDGDYYLRDEWIDEIIDKYKAESEDKE